MDIALGVLALLAYFVPMFIAVYREHPHQLPISLITVFLGWTVIAWLVCLAWSLSGGEPQRWRAAAD